MAREFYNLITLFFFSPAVTSADLQRARLISTDSSRFSSITSRLDWPKKETNADSVAALVQRIRVSQVLVSSRPVMSLGLQSLRTTMNH